MCERVGNCGAGAEAFSWARRVGTSSRAGVAGSKDLGGLFYADPHVLCERQPDMVLLATSIFSTESVLRLLLVHRFRRNMLFVRRVDGDELGTPICAMLVATRRAAPAVGFELARRPRLTPAPGQCSYSSRPHLSMPSRCELLLPATCLTKYQGRHVKNGPAIVGCTG